MPAHNRIIPLCHLSGNIPISQVTVEEAIPKLLILSCTLQKIVENISSQFLSTPTHTDRQTIDTQTETNT